MPLDYENLTTDQKTNCFPMDITSCGLSVMWAAQNWPMTSGLSWLIL